MSKLIIFSLIGIATIAISGYFVFSFFQSGQTLLLIDFGAKRYASDNIVVSGLRKGQNVTLPFIVRGEARVFENVLNVRLKEKDGTLLFESIAISQSPDMGIFGPFEKEVNYLFAEPKDKNVVLDVYWLSPKDGSEIDMVSLPLRLELGETSKAKLFFNNSNFDPEFSCNKVFPVERIVPKVQAPARQAMELLLEGPTALESSQGSFSSINSGVKIQKLTIADNVARVDFDEMLEFQVGGSCRVAATRAQITETLKQFSTVKNVIISINDRTEDILQP